MSDENFGNINIITRHKRSREDISQISDIQDTEREIKEMLAMWKTKSDAKLSKMVED